MTKEEIVVLQSVYATGIYDAGYDVQKESQRALDALKGAHREIKRLSAVAKKLGAWDCEKCQRLFVESMLTISPHSAVCDSCLGEFTT